MYLIGGGLEAKPYKERLEGLGNIPAGKEEVAGQDMIAFCILMAVT